MLVAHAGHWLIWVLYAIPVIAVLLAVVIASIRARAAEGGDRAAEREDATGAREDDEHPGPPG